MGILQDLDPDDAWHFVVTSELPADPDRRALRELAALHLYGQQMFREYKHAPDDWMRAVEEVHHFADVDVQPQLVCSGLSKLGYSSPAETVVPHEGVIRLTFGIRFDS